MFNLTRITPGERLRFFVIATLLFINSIIVQSNGVVAISGFISNTGPQWIPLVWGVDNLIIFLSATGYSLISDKFDRRKLASVAFFIAALIYLAMYFLFRLGVDSRITYTLLMVLNDQQWIVFALMIWALASDVFSVAENKRLFPLIGLVGFIGGILGNGLAASVARFLGSNVELMLFNSLLLTFSAGLAAFFIRLVKSTVRQASRGDTPKDILQDGLTFVREIPIYRYLALAMLLVGIGLNTVEYQLAVGGYLQYPGIGDLQAFLGLFRMVRMISLLIVQALLSSWLIKRIGFKSIFIILPTVMFLALAGTFFFPFLIVIAAGEYLVRITQEGVDDPSRRALVGLIPDEQRGRISAFLDGYLYPLGAVISCILIGGVLLLGRYGLLSQATTQRVYLGISALAAATAIWLFVRFRSTYDQSMLNWRLRRRTRKSDVMDKLDF
ncbi:MAG: hypothetical protein JXB85_06620 [Anaerolineales bacterium]|nr:hypothetical protein [Anaerolineales bacterium]